MARKLQYYKITSWLQTSQMQQDEDIASNASYTNQLGLDVFSITGKIRAWNLWIVKLLYTLASKFQQVIASWPSTSISEVEGWSLVWNPGFVTLLKLGRCRLQLLSTNPLNIGHHLQYLLCQYIQWWRQNTVQCFGRDLSAMSGVELTAESSSLALTRLK